jgi:hypothetical protein
VPEREYSRFEAALGEFAILGPDEVISLLRQRLETLDAANATEQEQIETWEAQIPRIFMIEAEYHLAQRRAEAEWVRGLLRELTDGTFPGLDGWRRYFETGQLPEEIAALVAEEGGGTAGS